MSSPLREVQAALNNNDKGTDAKAAGDSPIPIPAQVRQAAVVTTPAAAVATVVIPMNVTASVVTPVTPNTNTAIAATAVDTKAVSEDNNTYVWVSNATKDSIDGVYCGEMASFSVAQFFLVNENNIINSKYTTSNRYGTAFNYPPIPNQSRIQGRERSRFPTVTVRTPQKTIQLEFDFVEASPLVETLGSALQSLFKDSSFKLDLDETNFCVEYLLDPLDGFCVSDANGVQKKIVSAFILDKVAKGLGIQFPPVIYDYCQTISRLNSGNAILEEVTQYDSSGARLPASFDKLIPRIKRYLDDKLGLPGTGGIEDCREKFTYSVAERVFALPLIIAKELLSKGRQAPIFKTKALEILKFILAEEKLGRGWYLNIQNRSWGNNESRNYSESDIYKNAAKLLVEHHLEQSLGSKEEGEQQRQLAEAFRYTAIAGDEKLRRDVFYQVCGIEPSGAIASYPCFNLQGEHESLIERAGIIRSFLGGQKFKHTQEGWKDCAARMQVELKKVNERAETTLKAERLKMERSISEAMLKSQDASRQADAKLAEERRKAEQSTRQLETQLTYERKAAEEAQRRAYRTIAQLNVTAADANQAAFEANKKLAQSVAVEQRSAQRLIDAERMISELRKQLTQALANNDNAKPVQSAASAVVVSVASLANNAASAAVTPAAITYGYSGYPNSAVDLSKLPPPPPYEPSEPVSGSNPVSSIVVTPSQK